jgi:hypothetical protein
MIPIVIPTSLASFTKSFVLVPPSFAPHQIYLPLLVLYPSAKFEGCSFSGERFV